MNTTYLLLLALAGLVFLACFQASIRRILDTAFGATIRVCTGGIDFLGEAVQRLYGAAQRELNRIHLGGEHWRGMYVTGAAVHTAIFLFLALCDFYSVLLTLNAMMGVRSAALWLLPFSIESTLACAILLTGVYSGWMIKELSSERAALIPLHHYSDGARRWLRIASVASLCLTIIVVYAGGDYRGEILARQQTSAPTAVAPEVSLVASAAPDAPATAGEAQHNEVAPRTSARKAWAVRATMWALPLALLLGAMVAFVGPSLLFKLFVPGLMAYIMGMAWLGRTLLAIARALLQATWGVMNAVIQLLLRVAIVVARPIITLFRSLSDWASAQQRLNASRSGWKYVAVGVLAGLVLPLSSWSLDTELPRGSIGGTSLGPSAPRGTPLEEAAPEQLPSAA